MPESSLRPPRAPRPPVTRHAESLGAIAAALVLGGALAWAGSQGGLTWRGWPVFALCALLAYGLQWLVFVPSFLARTEHWFDLTGALTYLTLDGMVKATGHTKDNFCLACYTGDYPVPYDAAVDKHIIERQRLCLLQAF